MVDPLVLSWVVRTYYRGFFPLSFSSKGDKLAMLAKATQIANERICRSKHDFLLSWVRVGILAIPMLFEKEREGGGGRIMR